MNYTLSRIINLKILIIILCSYFLLHHSKSIAQPTLFGAGIQGGNGLGVIYGLPTGYTSLAQQYNLQNTDKGKNPKYSKFIQVSNGKMYGMVSYGGTANVGTLFEYDPTTNIYTPKMDFSNGVSTGIHPMGALIEAVNGKLYGLTNQGGVNSNGTLFEYDYVTGIFTKKVDFDATTGGGPFGTLFQASNNKLYGTTLVGGTSNFGVMFEYDITTGIYTKKIEFSGALNGKYPYGNIMEASNGKLYGMTSQGGTNNKGVLFEYDLASDVYTKKIDFNGTVNGSAPYGSLIQSSNTKLYGMTSTGGTNNKGVLFEYDIVTSTYSKKIDFNGATNGSTPNGNLMEASNGNLYGLTNAGGTYGFGVLFEYVSSTNILTKKLDFNTVAEGRNPSCTLFQAADNKLYGTTEIGGFGTTGVIFNYDITLNSYTKLIDFNGTANGGTLTGTLLHATDDKVYGLALVGGAHNLGVIFQYDYLTNTYAKKFEFDTLDGYSFWGSLMQASNGKLYGTTAGGGANYQGTLFEYDIISNVFAKKIDFDGVNKGSSSRAALIQATNGKLYGTTAGGGIYGNGTLFEYDITTDTYLKLFDFNLSNNGEQPSTLFQASNGKLYGMTYGGGLYGRGCIFEYDIASGAFTRKVDFDGLNKGGNAYGTLIEPVTGKLYGMTLGGGSANGYGVLFEYDFINDIYTKKITFNGASNGSFPNNSLIKASNNKLYGTTSRGGSHDLGTVFEYDIPSSTLTKKLDLYNATGCYAYLAGGYGGLIELALPCPTPTITSQPANLTMCNATTSYFTINDTCGTLYQWQFYNGTTFINLSNVAPYSGVNTKSLTITNAYPSLSGYQYRCIVSHHVSCSTISNTATLTVNVPQANNSQTNVLCNGGSTGAATITPVSGTSVYSYSWLPNGQLGPVVSNLSAGNYTCIITDTNLCATTKIISITQPFALGGSVVQKNVSCNGLSNGSATITPFNGAGGYTYSWSPASATTSTITNLAVGNYSCMITDANLCSVTKTLSITEPAVLMASANSNSITCFNGLTTMTVTGSGGTTPYTGTGSYTVSAGINTFTVTDTKGCMATNNINITQPSAISSSAVSSSISCYGSSASVTLSASGGTMPYTGVGNYTMSAGTNTYVISDADGCSFTNSITITEPSPLLVTMTASSVTCYGGIATVTISASGGTTPYTGVNTFSTTAGTATCIVSDANSCVSSQSIIITQPGAILNYQSLSLCNGSIVNVGTNTYTTSGTYSDVVSSLTNGCDSMIITNLTIANPIDTSTSNSGFTISANASGLTYQWIDCNNNQPILGEIAQSITVSANGGYAVIITSGYCSDTSACKTISSVGFSDKTLNSYLKLYPNPTKGELTIELTTDAQLTILDVLGKQVFKKEIESGKEKLNIAHLSEGVYFVKLQFNNSQQIQKIIISK